MSKVSLSASMFLAMAVSGCNVSIDKADYVTEPVQVSTSKGIVTCQLYTDDRVIWDEAINVPASMTIREGDAICLEEGKRRQNR